jgi:guanylate kinase
MAKLNQIIAVVNGKKTKTTKSVTDVYHNLQKPTLFEGISRTYRPSEEDGETLPPEKKLVQYKVQDAIREVREALTELWDVTATQDWANTKAVADVKVDGKSVLLKVPVTHLLFLEKQLTDLGTFVSKLPTLDSAEKWTFSQESDSYQSVESRTNKTKKVMRNHVKAAATDKHPAQVDVFTEDVKVGEWSTIKFSGAITAKRKNEMAERVAKLAEAVKFAREEANNLEVENQTISAPILDFVFGGK